MKKLLLLLVIICWGIPLSADTVVHTFEEEFHNWADTHVDTFQFPGEDLEFSRVTLQYTLTCPQSPGDCDPWDRLGHLYLRVPLTDSTWTTYELARIITPYDITGGNYPGACSWEQDVTDFQHLLRGQVILASQIDSYIGGDRGWLVTADFLFEEGIPEWDPIAVIPLWRSNWAVYGDPERPFSNWVPPVQVAVPAEAESLKVRILTTGHGQGNTYNAAEFFAATHYCLVGSDFFSHLLWYDNCDENPCSPQGGTWQFPRAGWCPGSMPVPWELTGFAFTPGADLMIYYYPESYENLCRPCEDCYDNPPPGCSDCNYNYNGHGEPYYSTEGELICYRRHAEGVSLAKALPGRVLLRQNFPNPFNPGTSLELDLEHSGVVAVEIYNQRGQMVRTLLTPRLLPAGVHRLEWDGFTDTGEAAPTGIYFARLVSARQTATVKMILLK
jgi:hypothetical protein